MGSVTPTARKEWTDTSPDKMLTTGKRPKAKKEDMPPMRAKEDAPKAASSSSKKKGLSSFEKAFAAARKAGKKTFSWNGKTYHTKLKGEK
jgi:hypothetical protein